MKIIAALHILSAMILATLAVPVIDTKLPTVTGKEVGHTAYISRSRKFRRRVQTFETLDPPDSTQTPDAAVDEVDPEAPGYSSEYYEALDDRLVSGADSHQCAKNERDNFGADAAAGLNPSCAA
ncbi:hypothetical protein DFH07DRAFT_978100 [Mycena maculata]|uniref:Uncharacterized protein n=1 Tax=Mycena maculata TaxID=230809 RepID=A0AAD7N462_9AGAR|nr:hypothetical protein DFH07DRAFT_978100 [Mycena maculata]